MATNTKLSSEIKALSLVLEALADLETKDQLWVLQTAASRLDLGDVTGIGSRGGDDREEARSGSRNRPHDETPRAFMRAKNPQNDVQRAACLGYYLMRYRDQPHFKSTDLTGLNTEAAGHKINMPRALNNATNQNRYFAAAGSGNKQLTPLGEDIVEALPDQTAVAALDQGNHTPRKKKTPKNREKKKTVKG